MKPQELYNKFLDLETPEPTPAELLGLQQAPPPDEPAVRAALAQRLEQVDAHAQARTPEADQVRMALHAAAAVLGDQMLRQAAARRQQAPPPDAPATSANPKAPADSTAPAPDQATPPRPAGDTAPLPAAPATPGGDTTSPSPAPARPPAPPRAEATPTAPAPPPSLELSPLEGAIVAVLVGGGWTSRSQQQLATIAMQWGLTPEQLIQHIRDLAARWSAGAATPAAPAAQAGEATVAAASPRWGARLAVLLALVVGVLAVVLSLTAVLTRPGPARPRPEFALPDAPEVATTPAEPTDAADAPRTDAPPPPAERSAAELALAAQRLEREIIAAGGTLPDETQRRWQRWLAEVGGRWPGLNQRELAEVNRAAVEAVQSAGDVEAAARHMANLLAAAAAQVDAEPTPLELARRSYVAGLLAAAHAERRTSRALRRAVEEATADWPVLLGAADAPRALDAAFARGALASLRHDLPQLVAAVAAGQPDALDLWTYWRAALTAAHRLLGADPQDDHLAAVEALLLEAPETSDAAPTYAQLLRRLLSLIDFADPEAHGTVVQWLLDPRIRTRDLHTVTSTIVELELAPGVDDAYILAADAPALERTRLTRRWSQEGLADADSEQPTLSDAAGSSFAIDAMLRTDWMRRAEGELEQTIDGSAATHRLRRAVRYARLRAAAEQVARGDLDQARNRLAQIRVELNTQPRPEEPPIRGDGELTTALAMPGLTENRIVDLIRAFAERHPLIGPADARTLATLALAESSLQIRDTAQERIRWDYGDSPNLVLALLDLTAGTRVIRTTGLAETVERITGERLPEPQDDRFLDRLRLALTKHLLELRESAYAGDAVDELAHHLAAAYQAAADREGNVEAPDVEARRLLELWEQRAAARGAVLPGDPDHTAISRRLAAALRLAPGPMQRFVALQRALLERMAAVVIAESPPNQEAVLRVVRSAQARTLAAQSVLTQIEELEHAMLEVMHIRFAAATAVETPPP